MEILEFLLSFFMQEYGGENLNSLFSLLKENDFDIKKTLSGLSPEKIAPIVKSVFSHGGFNQDNEKGSQNISEPNGLIPIKDIADENIINTLNGYFG